MGISRRGFLRGGLAGAAGVGLSLVGAKAQAAPLGFEATALDSGATPIMQGYTDATTAQFKIFLESIAGINVRVLAPDDTLRPLKLLGEEANPFDASERMFHFIASELTVGVDYRLQLIDVETGVVFDERLFAALELSGERTRFALLSCMLDVFLSKQSAMWDALARSKPEVIFMIGDNCYADFGSDGTEKAHWRRFAETRRNLDNFRWKRLIPTLAVWDDHDFGGNNWDRRNPFREGALKCFKMYFASRAGDALEHGPGVSQIFRFRGQRFLMMDDRYYRDPGDVPGGSHWGAEQEEWLFAKLHENEQPAWILNGSQFFGGYMDKDSFQQRHEDAFKRFIRRLREVKAPVMLGSGDVHFSELMRIERDVLGYETFEITSSSIHSMTFPYHHMRYSNPRRLEATWHHNYVLIDCARTDRGIELEISSEGTNRTVYFHRRLKVSRAGGLR